jgi:hypothetical protein
MAAKLKIEKRGDEIFKKSSPLKLLSYWANGFKQEDFYGNFPVSYVKLSSAVAAILVGGLKCQTKFWKGITQGSFQQSLVKIGSVVSEEKIF